MNKLDNTERWLLVFIIVMILIGYIRHYNL